ncbi:MAG: ATP-binding protein, partial [Candidatus Thorarchaeota archaeon]
MSKENKSDLLGRVIGNTGGNTVSVALVDSFSVKRGGFIRILHVEEKNVHPNWVLGRVIGFSRESPIYSQDMITNADRVATVIRGETGERNTAQVELVGFREPQTGEIRIPRRPIDPGAKVQKVDADFLNHFYDYNPSTSIQLGTLIGYETGENAVPIFLDVNRMATEHIGILAMTGAGKSYTVGRICELLLTRHNASIIVFDPHGEYGRAFREGKLRFGQTTGFDTFTDNELQETKEKIEWLQAEGAGLQIFAPKSDFNDSRYLSGY